MLISGFNVDTALSDVISGPENSYFGYTVGIILVNDEAR